MCCLFGWLNYSWYSLVSMFLLRCLKFSGVLVGRFLGFWLLGKVVNRFWVFFFSCVRLFLVIW